MWQAYFGAALFDWPQANATKEMKKNTPVLSIAECPVDLPIVWNLSETSTCSSIYTNRNFLLILIIWPEYYAAICALLV